MKTLQISQWQTRFKKINDLKLESFQREYELKPGQALLKHLASIICQTDYQTATGTYYKSFPAPIIPGYSFVAQVIDLSPPKTTYPPNCLQLAVGDMVAVMSAVGGLTTHSIIQVDDLKKSIVRIPIPFTYKNPSDERAVDLAKVVAIILASTTAYQMIHRTGVCEIVKQGDNILVHSAAGAVGSALVSLLRLQFKDTVNIYGAASSHKSTFVKSLGATHIDYKTTKFDDYFQENNVHNRIVFDAVGSFITKQWIKNKLEN